MDDLRDLDLYTPGFIAFDATVRLGSFTAAARELNVTQPTISYRIKNLEERLGIVLFLRRGRGTDLTFEGKVVLGQVRETMEALLSSARAIRRSRNDPNTVTLLSSASFATHWILPRLPLFRNHLQEVKLRILTTEMTNQEVDDSVDLWFMRGGGIFSRRRAWQLSKQVVTPVCAPSLLASLQRKVHLDDLSGVELIDLNDPLHPHTTWSQWALVTKRSLPDDAPRYVFTDYGIATKAALAGHGMLLGWRHLILDYLRSGELVALSDEWVASGDPFWLAQNNDTLNLPTINRFKDLILAEARHLMDF